MKPDCLDKGLVKECTDRIIKLGCIIKMDYRKVTSQEIMNHYKDNLKNVSNEIKNRVLDYFEGKFIIIIIIEGNDIIKKMRKEIGASDPEYAEPGTIRRKFANDTYKKALKEKRSCKNVIHASDSHINFEKEYKVWFT